MLLYLNLHYHCHYYDPSFSVRQGHTVLAGQWPPTREEGAGEDGTGSTPSEIRRRRRCRGRRRRGRGRGGGNQAALLVFLSAGGLCLGLASGASEEGDREDSAESTPSEIRQRRQGRGRLSRLAAAALLAGGSLNLHFIAWRLRAETTPTFSYVSSHVALLKINTHRRNRGTHTLGLGPEIKRRIIITGVFASQNEIRKHDAPTFRSNLSSLFEAKLSSHRHREAGAAVVPCAASGLQ